MKKLAAFLLLIVFSFALSVPASASHTENRGIGENQREAKRAAKQQRKYSKKQVKKQRKMMKGIQKNQKKAAKHHR
jgi:hypothetical protein